MIKFIGILVFLTTTSFGAASYDSIFAIVDANDTIAARKLTKVDLQSRFDHDITPLHIVCDIGTIEMVQIFLEKGADPNVANEFEYSPLDICLDKGRNDCVLALFAHKADPNFKMPEGRNGPSILRFMRGKDSLNTEFIKLLIDHGASLELSDSEGETPFLSAACKGTPELLALMLRVNPNVIHDKDEDDTDALGYAKLCKNKATQKYLKNAIRVHP